MKLDEITEQDVINLIESKEGDKIHKVTMMMNSLKKELGAITKRYKDTDKLKDDLGKVSNVVVSIITIMKALDSIKGKKK